MRAIYQTSYAHPHQGGDCSVVDGLSEPQVGQETAPTGPGAHVSVEARCDGCEDGATAVIIPSEWLKTLLALACCSLGTFLTAVSLSYVHDHVPKHSPLPDISLSMVPRTDWAINACEVLLLMNMAIALTVCLAHRYRAVLLRRAFLLLAIVYIYRSVTIAVTAMPDPDSTRNCEPRLNRSLGFSEFTGRVYRIAMGAGFSLSKTHVICGDSIFSGHTASLVLAYQMIREYSAESAKPLRWASLVTSLFSFMFLVISHSHYTVDLIIGYWLASRLFLIYHAMASCSPAARRDSHLAQVWWFPVFQFFECNVPSRLPCEFQLPWRHGCFQRAYHRLGSIRMRLRRGN